MIKRPDKRLWSKFSSFQKKFWIILIRKFLIKDYWVTFKQTPTDKEMEHLAHNWAFLAVDTYIPPTEEEIMGALARGYCDKNNAGKTVDPTLIISMQREILKVQQINDTKNKRSK